MDKELNEDKKFENIDYTEQKIANHEFVNCEFINCNFSKSNLSNSDFMDCVFKECNLSMAILNNTGIKNIQFIACKLMGINFSICNNFLFSASFTNCQLDYAVFYKKKMKKTPFIDCSLKNADFTETDLSMVSFANCDLLNATFVNTVLEKVDFRAAKNYTLDPELNSIKKAKFSHLNLAGLLAKYNIDIE